MKFYWTNDSYPELRPVESMWERNRIWWRAFASAMWEREFWVFVAVQSTVIVVTSLVGGAVIGPTMIVNGVNIHPWRDPARTAVMIAGALTFSVLAMTWGSELMRPHLRRASSLCRDACPNCGQLLTDRIDEAMRAGDTERRIRCAECGGEFTLEPFVEPYRVPRARPRSTRTHGIGGGV